MIKIKKKLKFFIFCKLKSVLKELNYSEHFPCLDTR